MKVVIVGGGPAGMLSAIMSAKENNETIILEKMNTVGKKLRITGKGRCNITNAIDIGEFINNIPGNGKFLYSAFKNFTNQDIINLLKEEGLETKVERGNRVFPVTDSAQSVVDVLVKKLKKLGVKVITNAEVIDILVNQNKVTGVEYVITEKQEKIQNNKKENISIGKIEINNKERKEEKVKEYIDKKIEKIDADKVILATGGVSYPLTGSTGDGQKIAKRHGHNIKEVKPALVPMECYEKDMCMEMQGLSLKNVDIKLTDKEKNKKIYEDFGEMLIAHFGVTGPVIISSSSHLIRYKNIDELLKMHKIELSIDLKPALSKEKLDLRIRRDFEENKNKSFKNSLNKLLPQKMINVIIKLSKINPDKKVNEITREEREYLGEVIKNLKLTISKFRPIEEAIVTSGGIDVKEINPKTMESKLIERLYFAGEIIDVDGYTGGFNLQIAYSTGATAGMSSKEN